MPTAGLIRYHIVQLAKKARDRFFAHTLGKDVA
jgi:hypothetical protein